MTNGEKFVTPEQRAKAFDEYCHSRICYDCPAWNNDDSGNCRFSWLDLEAEDNNPIPLPCPFCGSTDVVMQDVGGFELECLGCGFNTPAYMEKEKLISEYQRVARAVIAAKEIEAK